jgi:hypothetical protein
VIDAVSHNTQHIGASCGMRRVGHGDAKTRKKSVRDGHLKSKLAYEGRLAVACPKLTNSMSLERSWWSWAMVIWEMSDVHAGIREGQDALV